MAKIPFFIAKRYLFTKKSTQAINIIAWVSLLRFAIGVFAIIVVLSTMNGFEKLVFGMYNDFSPDVKVMPLKGKVMKKHQGLEDYYYNGDYKLEWGEPFVTDIDERSIPL